MQRFALAPRGRKEEQILVAVPRLATAWTIARRNRGLHRLLVPVEAPLDAVGALRYIVERLADHVASVHLVNVQRPLMSRDVTALTAADTVLQIRRAAGERLLALVRRSVELGALRTTAEVAYGAPAERICALAQERRCSGIVIGRDGFELGDLVGRSVVAKILQLACVPVTIVNARTVATLAVGNVTPLRHIDPADEGRSSARDTSTAAQPGSRVSSRSSNPAPRAATATKYPRPRCGRAA